MWSWVYIPEMNVSLLRLLPPREPRPDKGRGTMDGRMDGLHMLSLKCSRGCSIEKWSHQKERAATKTVCKVRLDESKYPPPPHTHTPSIWDSPDKHDTGKQIQANRKKCEVSGRLLIIYLLIHLLVLCPSRAARVTCNILQCAQRGAKTVCWSARLLFRSAWRGPSHCHNCC